MVALCRKCSTPVTAKNRGGSNGYICRPCHNAYHRSMYHDRKKRSIQHFASHLLSSAKKRGKRFKDFELDKKWLADKINVGRCEATGLCFEFSGDENRRSNFFAPSIDRVDSQKGYTKANSRLVVWGYNMAKGEHTDEHVLMLSYAVLKGRL